jgi:hypothetical protein
LARKVRWVAAEDGDGAGYDVLSFDQAGRERLLEVKTTNGSARTPFFLQLSVLGIGASTGFICSPATLIFSRSRRRWRTRSISGQTRGAPFFECTGQMSSKFCEAWLMRCTKCGGAGEDTGDLQVRNLEIGPDGRITGSICTTTKCSTCGVSERKLDVQLDLQIPSIHRTSGHDLEIDFESKEAGSPAAGFPVKVRCSCEELAAKGVLMLRTVN